ncbi:hypothetical protein BZG36_00048 [Bifiguratus adelaidae]|uniref:Enhancer of polycomb-like protein n=1 Tax=Bifiguratus adelaidae TaxID=1938954 RepID=A0A261Y8E6_9FUNG|nr:hypothetical protein BZG36_00048 [Bifiguratus adelaidae]
MTRTSSPHAPRFRNRKLSNKHQLPIYRASELPDLDEFSVQRHVTEVETGVWKEEEVEHHLQAAMSASQAAVTTGGVAPLYIPTPDASKLIADYDKCHHRKFPAPSALIRFSAVVEDCIGSSYTMDEEDEAWLKEYAQASGRREAERLSEDQFEEIMAFFENVSVEVNPYFQNVQDISQIPSFADIEPYFITHNKAQLKIPAKHVYAHWLQRRQKRGGKPIIPQLQFEEAVKNEDDPYVCFRRRETKTIRKTRRTDQQSLEKLRRLRIELEMARSLLDMVSKRERYRKESLLLEQKIFESRCVVMDHQRALGIKDEEEILIPPRKKKKLNDIHAAGATIKIPLHKIRRDEDYARNKNAPSQLELELARRRKLDEGWEDITENPFQPFPKSTPLSYYRYLHIPSQPQEHRSTPRRQPSYRMRMGRGGRVFLDRHHVELLHHMDSTETTHNYFSKSWRAYDFDDDLSDDEYTIDDGRPSLLRYRCSLFSELDLRNLITTPYFNAMTGHGHQQRNGVNPRLSSLVNGPASPTMSKPPSGAQSPSGVKKSNQKPKMTPQQAAVHMANSMMSANLAAVAAQNGHVDQATAQRYMQLLQTNPEAAKQMQAQFLQQQQQRAAAVAVSQAQKNGNPPTSPQPNGNRVNGAVGSGALYGQQANGLGSPSKASMQLAAQAKMAAHRFAMLNGQAAAGNLQNAMSMTQAAAAAKAQSALQAQQFAAQQLAAAQYRVALAQGQMGNIPSGLLLQNGYANGSSMAMSSPGMANRSPLASPQVHNAMGVPSPPFMRQVIQSPHLQQRMAGSPSVSHMSPVNSPQN